MKRKSEERLYKGNYLLWIDYAKVISICLVISFHTPPRIDGFLGAILEQLRMPAFFLISGILFNIQKYPNFKTFVVHRARQLLIPYLSFFTIFYLLWLSFGRTLAGDSEPLAMPLLEFFSGQPKTVVAPMWFVVCLFSMQVVCYLIQRCVPQQYVFPLCVLLSAASAPLEGYVQDYWMFLEALEFLPFYAFAICYRQRLSNISGQKHRGRYFLSLGLALTLIALQWQGYGGIFRGVPEGLIVVSSQIVSIAAGLLLLPFYIMVVTGLGKAIGYCQSIDILGKNTIIILALQNYCIGLIKILADKMSGSSSFLEQHAWANLPITLLVLSLHYPIILVINRYMPMLIGRSKEEGLSRINEAS